MMLTDNRNDVLITIHMLLVKLYTMLPCEASVVTAMTITLLCCVNVVKHHHTVFTAS